MSEGPLFAYREHQRRGELRHDQIQSLAAEKLQLLWHALRDYRPSAGRSGWRARLGLTRRPASPAPQGLYLYGKVGRGKSMLMDLFYATVDGHHKRRVHFHAFMLEIHDTMHRWRQSEGSLQDPLPRIARDIAAETWLLCFDEFQVTNIADAMILGRLFEALFDQGVVIVATGNTHPDELYKDGLQRDRFLPFIEILKQRVEILELEGPRDYRRERLAGMQVYFTPLDSAAGLALEAAFRILTEGARVGPEQLVVMGRTLQVPAAARQVARFTFGELCGRPLGAPDYLAIARTYHTVVIAGVPILPKERRNEANRLVTLIDALYEQRVNVIISAEVEPDRLCADYGAVPAFERTASRLIEMQSADYIRMMHTGGDLDPSPVQQP